ncbi:EamA family transporter [Frateuria aurantia]
MSALARARLQIHFCVVLWGLTAVLGRLIDIPAIALVWWRMTLVVLTLALLPASWRALRRLRTRQWWACAGIGVLVTLHWLTFYLAVKLANASVAATCIALGPAFLALIEPWIAGRRFNPRELLLSLLVIPGVALVAGGTPAGMHAGMLIGVGSAALLAVFSACNKRVTSAIPALAITSIEFATGSVCLAVLSLSAHGLGRFDQWPHGHDVWWLLALAFACTLLPYLLALVALRQLSAFEVQIITNLEPVYAVVAAALLLHEQRHLQPSFYLGMALIVGVIAVQPLLRKPAQRGAAVRSME